MTDEPKNESYETVERVFSSVAHQDLKLTDLGSDPVNYTIHMIKKTRKERDATNVGLRILYFRM